jgi:hypothetical protein
MRVSRSCGDRESDAKKRAGWLPGRAAFGKRAAGTAAGWEDDRERFDRRLELLASSVGAPNARRVTIGRRDGCAALHPNGNVGPGQWLSPAWGLGRQMIVIFLVSHTTERGALARGC